MKSFLVFVVVIMFSTKTYSANDDIQTKFIINNQTYDLNPKGLPECVNMPYDNCYGELVSSITGHYFGEFHNGNFNGYGLLINGPRTFIGQFKDDSPTVGSFVKNYSDFKKSLNEKTTKESYADRSKRIQAESEEYQQIGRAHV